MNPRNNEPRAPEKLVMTYLPFFPPIPASERERNRVLQATHPFRVAEKLRMLLELGLMSLAKQAGEDPETEPPCSEVFGLQRATVRTNSRLSKSPITL